MKAILLSMALAVFVGPVFAGIEPAPAPEEMSSSSGDATGALVLLALVGMVVALGQTGGFTTRNRNELDVNTDDVDDDAGF